MNSLNSILNWSIRVGRLFNIPISLHISILFFLLPVISGRGDDPLHSLEYVILVVLSILLHELGHALMAKHYKLTDLSIMLHGLGGFASSSGDRNWKQSLYITLAGPAVTFCLGILLTSIGSMGPKYSGTVTDSYHQFWLIYSIGKLNILLGFVNMIPALPWDGGNALRAFLNRKMTFGKAVRAVAHLGLVITVPIIIYSLISKDNFILMFAGFGLYTSVVTLMQSGGIRFGEFFVDRKDKIEMDAQRKREQARKDAYLDEVHTREKEREEKERLRKMFEVIDGDK